MSSRVVADARFRVSFTMLLFLGGHFILVLSTPLLSFPWARPATYPLYKHSQTNFQEQRVCALYPKKSRSSPLQLGCDGQGTGSNKGGEWSSFQLKKLIFCVLPVNVPGFSRVWALCVRELTATLWALMKNVVCYCWFVFSCLCQTS